MSQQDRAAFFVRGFCRALFIEIFTNGGVTVALVVIFFILMFMAIGGTYLNIDPYDSLIWVKTLISFVLLTATMMVFPVCYKVFKSGNVSNAKGKKVCNWNCVAVLGAYMLIDIIVMGGIYDETFENLGANLVYGLMFLYINKKLLFSKKTEQNDVLTKTKEPIVEVQACASQEAHNEKIIEKSQSQTKPVCKQHTISTPIVTVPQNSKIKYCSQCGKAIDGITKKCTGCGKQYFKGIPWKIAGNIGIAAILIFSIGMNIYQYISAKDKPDYIIPETNSDQSFYEWIEEQDRQKKIDFFDTYIVLVEDDGTNWYHKYECDKFKGDNFWAFNLDAAKGEGYTACPYCH